METFADIKELITTLKREEVLMSEMFAKRKALDYKYSYALEIVDDNPDRLQYLITQGVIRENGNFLELDDVYLEFFEQILSVNETLNIAYIDENLESITHNIQCYFNEHNERKKQDYLKLIKRYLRNIGNNTLRNVIDLRRNIEETFKNEANYKNKKLKLENLDKKRRLIDTLIEKTYFLLTDGEVTFFRVATDEELKTVINNLKYDFKECSHNLIEIEKQIIDYLNQIKLQGQFTEKIRKIKYLKDHFLIKAESNIEQVIGVSNDVIFEKQIKDSLKLSVDYLRDNDDVSAIIRKVYDNRHDKKQFQTPIADTITDDYLQMAVESVPVIDREGIKNQFVASGDNLFGFLSRYQFDTEISFAERVALFCQIASLFENELLITDDYQHSNGVEFAMIYPK